MPHRPLPARPNLEQLKNQAKDLLKAYRAGQPSARMRFRESLPRLRGASNDATRPSVSLRDAQHVIAVEYGFSNWSLMHAYIKEREDIVMLEMTVDRVAVNPNSQQRVVVLKAKEVSMYLPIWVGPAEGDSIMFKLRGEELPRPMTHDLMDSMISDLGARVTRVVVNAMQGDMFLGRIVLQRNGTTIERDSRPSDAIALAVRTGAAIYVEEEVLDRAGVSFDPETGLPTSTNANWTVRSIEEIDNAFSDEAKGLLRQAGANATRLGRKEITPEDILLALTGEPQGNGARVLADLGLDFAEARSQLGGDVESGEPSSSRAREFSEACQCVLSLARREAHMLFSGETGTEHILLGLALAEDGLASWILKDAGIEAEAVRAVMTGLPQA